LVGALVAINLPTIVRQRKRAGRPLNRGLSKQRARSWGRAGRSQIPILRLAAAAVDPKRQHGYRREFVAIVNALEPLDALVLPMLAQPGDMEPSKKEAIASRLGSTTDQVELAFKNLARLGLVYFDPSNTC